MFWFGIVVGIVVGVSLVICWALISISGDCSEQERERGLPS